MIFLSFKCRRQHKKRTFQPLVDRKDEGGKRLHAYLKSVGITSTYISGDSKKDTISKAIKDFNDEKIRILIGSTVIGEEVNIKSAKHLIIARGGKSEIAMVQGQAWGRAVRLHRGKTTAKIYDFKMKDTKYMTRHLDERIEIFKNQFGVKSNI